MYAAAAAKLLSCIWLFVTLWSVACQVPLSMGFSKQEYWSGLPCPPSEDLPDPGIKPQSPALQAESLLLSHQGSPCTCVCVYIYMYVYLYWNASAVSEWKLLLCQTPCDPMDYTVHGILQARILEWVDFPFSRGSSWPRDRTWVSCIAGRFFTLWVTREVQGR